MKYVAERELMEALEDFISENTTASRCWVCGAEGPAPCEPSCIVGQATALRDRLYEEE